MPKRISEKQIFSLLVAQSVQINNYSIFKQGDEIPGYTLHTEWNGSFADVKTKGEWKNGKWTVVVSRTLKTGNDMVGSHIQSSDTSVSMADSDTGRLTPSVSLPILSPGQN
jgi:hypothetical protein